MSNSGYKITDWIFFFDQSQKKKINEIITDKNKNNDFITWKIISIALPFLTFLVVAFANIIFSNGCPFLGLKFLNNGSIPIISFGIISSGVSFLMEEMKENKEYHHIRRRVMGVALLFLFFSASLYLLQTLNVIDNQFTLISEIIILVLSLYISLFSISVGSKMYLLQSGFIPKDFREEVEENVQGLTKAVEDLD